MTKIKVVSKKNKSDTTDKALFVQSYTTQESICDWDTAKVVETLVKEGHVAEDLAKEIAQVVESKIMKMETHKISTTFIRSLCDEELEMRGMQSKLLKQKLLSIPTYDLEQAFFSKTEENANIQSNTPETINMYIAETVLKQYALNRIFSQQVADGHFTGAYHIHDIGFPTRVYCGSHSLVFLLKYGLIDLINLSTKSSPAKRAHTLTGHLNTFLSSMQAYWAGALGLAFVNTFYSPLLVGYTAEQMKKEAQYLIFSLSQSAFSRGSQTLFIDFNCDTFCPPILEDVPAIVGGGKYATEILIDGMPQQRSENFRKVFWILSPDTKPLTHEDIVRYYELFPLEYHGIKISEYIKQKRYTSKILTYLDFEKEAQMFLEAMMDIWDAGDMNNNIFPFPKMQFHCADKVFIKGTEPYRLLQKACTMSAKNGLPYFVYDRGDETVLSQCCRLIEKISDTSIIKQPERLRFTGFQNITINLPQAAYRAKGDFKKTIEEIKWAMDLALQAHFQKKKFIASLMDEPNKPLWQIGKTSPDGNPYVDLDKCTYIMGMVGLNECIQHLTGKELHETDEALMTGIKLMTHMYSYVKKLGKENNLKLVLEESPAESASARLAKIDSKKYPESKAYIKGNQESGNVYYTNSVHLSASAPVPIIERIEKQARFSQLIEAGAITHIFLGDQNPSAEAIESLVKKTWENTQCPQLTISPELIYCSDCGHLHKGFDFLNEGGGENNEQTKG